MQFEPLPLTAHELDEYWRNARRDRRPLSMGGHLMRRRGESLEFRDFGNYTPGDDIRHVDWRASLRSGAFAGTPAGWIVRRFAAEEQLRIVLSLDTRNTLHLPIINARRNAPGRVTPAVNISKLQVGRWLIEALAGITLEHADRVVLHQLFGSAGITRELVGRNATAELTTTLDELCAPPADDRPNLDDLERYLPPTAIWVVVTDLYCDLETAAPLFERIASAQDGMRWVILVDLDSWPYERHLLTSGAPLMLIDGPATNEEKRFTPARIASVEARIAEHKRTIMHKLGPAGDLVSWLWPGTLRAGNAAEQIKSSDDFANFFRDRFLNEEMLQRIFEPDV